MTPIIENMLQEAIQLSNSGNHDESLKLLRECLKCSDNSWIKLNIANVLVKSGKDNEAAKYLEEVIQAKDSDVRTLLGVNHLGLVIFRFDLAVLACERAYSLAPTSPDVMAALIRAKNESRKRDAMGDLCDKFILQLPNHSWGYIQRANYQLSKGDFDSSYKSFEQAIKIDAKESYAFSGIIKTKKFKEFPDTLIKKMDYAISASTEPEDKARIYFAKAKILNDVGQYEEAWSFAEKANDLKAKLAPFSSVTHRKYIQQIKSYFQSDNKSVSQNPDEHIWIVGMPRSGTTLIEQILSGDKSLYPGGETPAIDAALYSRFRGSSYLESSFTEEQLNSISRSYSTFFRRFSNFRGKRVIDKVPFNYFHIGLFKKLFPKGKVINFVRNKYDVSTSIFFENFSLLQNYTHRIEDTFTVYDSYQELMSFWSELYPDSVLNINYDDFVTNHEESKQKIVEFTGIKNLSEVGYQQSDNLIETPSVWQARQKLYAHAIERWKRYPQMVKIVESL